MKIVSFLFLILFSFSANAQVTQQWVTRYNGPVNKNDNAKAIAVDKQGNVYVTGLSEVSESTSAQACLTIKYNSEGVEQWTASYNGPWPSSLALDNKGNVYVTGGDLDYVTIKYNSEGVEQWVARYDKAQKTDFAHSIAVDKEGNICVTGECYNGGTDYDYDIVTVKYNPEGVQLWVQVFDGPGKAYGYTVKTDDAGNVFVLGNNNGDMVTIKYDAAGAQQWVARFKGYSSAEWNQNSLALDNKGNIYVSGFVTTTASGYDFATIKYNSAGVQQWAQYYNGPKNSTDIAYAIAVDSSGNVIVTGRSAGTGGDDFATVKYNSEGIQQWASRYNGTGDASDWVYSMVIDADGNSYVTGYVTRNGDHDYITIKYNPEGVETWVDIYNGPGNKSDGSYASAIDDNGNIYVTGESMGGTNYDYATIKYVQDSKLSITKPVTGSKFIAGQIDTIRWNGWQTGQIIQIDYSVDEGNAYIAIDSLVSANSGYYLWDVPDSLLTTKAKIRITDMDNAAISDESDVFRIKPYLLTRLNEDSTYYAYRKDRDRFGFRNSRADMWPQYWSDRFDYQGEDPFTKKPYPQNLPGGNFANVVKDSAWFPDWVSWVNAFSVKTCYKSMNPVVYDPAALFNWWSGLHQWGGSCYGIAVANALVFSHKEQFQAKYPDFIINWDPIDVISNDGVKSTVNTLFTYNFGKLAIKNGTEGPKKTPVQTLQEIKQILSEDNAKIKTLYIANNTEGGTGAHEILVYALEKDQFNDSTYYAKVYDNAYPNSDNPIIFNISANEGNGSWSTMDYIKWGGYGKIYLNAIVDSFFNYATMTNKAAEDYKSPFILPDDWLEIRNNPNSDIKIRSFNTGQVTGYSDSLVLNEIPNSIPLMIINGSEMPPFGYLLPAPGLDFYIIEMNNFHSDKINTFFFTGNKSFLYQRNQATQTQTDQLFFDGGIHINNYDNELKTFSLLSLVNETTQEKLCIFRSLKTNVNEEVVMDIPDSNTIKITTYSTAQEYNIELYYLTGSGIGKFIFNNITLPENSSHTIIPDWENLKDSMLIVVVDLNDDYIMDDTLYFNNQYTGYGDDENSPLLQRGFSMSQNYPNPFNTNTFITYQLPIASQVTLKVLDLLGNEVATLVNENKPAGNYKVEFDASFFAPGIYFYKLQTGNFSLTKKMILYR
jgi:uncharacterized delta-60 repeat protein